MTTTDITPKLNLTRSVEEFLFAEAELLDGRAFPQWLALFTQDCYYWIPCGSIEADPSRQVSLVYDTWQTLAERVWRFEGGLAYAQQPPSVTSHLVGNVLVKDVEPGGHPQGDLVTVTSRFLVTEFRKNELFQHAGRNEHRLVRQADGTFLIQRKYVELVNAAGYLGNLSLPL